MWSKQDGFPGDDYFAALDPRFEHVIDEKMSRDPRPARGPGRRALRARRRRGPGSAPELPVAVANVDAHVSAPAVTVTEPGTMVAIMGTSICHILLGDASR